MNRRLALGFPAVPLLLGAQAVHRPDVALEQDPCTPPALHESVEDPPARAGDGRVNVVVETPAGTTAEGEVDWADGHLRRSPRTAVGASWRTSALPVTTEPCRTRCCATSPAATVGGSLRSCWARRSNAARVIGALELLAAAITARAPRAPR